MTWTLAVVALGLLAWDAWRRTLAARRIDDREAIEARLSSAEELVRAAAAAERVDEQLAEVADRLQALQNAIALGGRGR